MQAKHVEHSISPVFDANSKILILGTLPSPKSREQSFFYGHPQNRFWRVLAEVLACCVPQNVDEKKEMLLSNHIALWDVLKSCDITGASDSSIKNATPNDFSLIFHTASIRKVFTTGAAATKLYQKFTGEDSIMLPSPSPANCAVSFQKLVAAYQRINVYLT